MPRDLGGGETVGSAVRNALSTFRFFVGVREFSATIHGISQNFVKFRIDLEAGGYRTRAIR